MVPTFVAKSSALWSILEMISVAFLCNLFFFAPERVVLRRSQSDVRLDGMCLGVKDCFITGGKNFFVSAMACI